MRPHPKSATASRALSTGAAESARATPFLRCAVTDLIQGAGNTAVNLAGSYELFQGIEVIGRIENLLDQEYEEVLGFSTPGIGVFIGVQATHRFRVTD